MENNNKSKFGAYLIEVLIVVIGITIAFAVDNFAQATKRNNEEKLYLEALINDLDKDIEQLKSISDSSQKVINQTGEIFNLIYSKAEANRFTRELVTVTYATPYFSSNNGTYLSLINSGDLKILSDFSIRQALVTLYKVDYQKVTEAEGLIKALVTGGVNPYILKNVDFHPYENRVVSTEPLGTKYAINLFGSFYNLMAKRNNDYRVLIEHCENVKDLLSSAL